MSEVPVPLADLPSHHPGGMVLERCFRKLTQSRDRAVVVDEYKVGKYTSALKFARESGKKDPLAIRMHEFARDAESDWCFSRGDELFCAPLRKVQAGLADLLIERVTALAGGCKTIVETGCGYGFNLWRLATTMPGRACVGGDIADTAIELADYLYGKGNPRVEIFDYYEPVYRLIERSEGPVFVYTCHSIEQLPTAAPFLKTLARYANKIVGVAHFEPVFEVHGDSLVGHLRRAHAESVDYNRDLLTLLKSNKDIVVHTVEPNVYGINPLNPTTFIHWSFR